MFLKSLLTIQNLKATGNGKEILKGVSLNVKPGQIQALLGPNASGKSTLAQVILGNPVYQVTGGKILFQGKEITDWLPEKRAKSGIALAFQSPPAIKGVKLDKLLSRISAKQITLDTLGTLDTLDTSRLLARDLNVDFSGGEKKMSELLQIFALKPKLVILDEIDSGLDMEKINQVAKLIKKGLLGNKVAILLITHSGKILHFLKPDLTNVMVDGEIICQEENYQKVLATIKKYGYEKCQKCPFH